MFPVTLKIDWSQAPLLMNRSLLTDLFRNEHCAHSNCRPRQALGLMSYPLGMCIGTKPNAAETEPSATSTEEPIGGFLISLKSLGIWGPWILKWITSADNPGDSATVERHCPLACYCCPVTSLFMCQTMSLHPLAAITVLGDSVTTAFGDRHCPWAQSRYIGPSLYCSQDEITRKKL